MGETFNFVLHWYSFLDYREHVKLSFSPLRKCWSPQANLIVIDEKTPLASGQQSDFLLREIRILVLGF